MKYIRSLGGIRWARYGIKSAHQLFSDGVFKMFKDLQLEFKIPNKHFYSYLQLRHVVVAQFGLTEVSLSSSRLEKLLFGDDHSKLISRYYSLLLTSSSQRMEKIARQWTSDIPTPTDEIWSEVVRAL